MGEITYEQALKVATLLALSGVLVTVLMGMLDAQTLSPAHLSLLFIADCTTKAALGCILGLIGGHHSGGRPAR